MLNFSLPQNLCALSVSLWEDLIDSVSGRFQEHSQCFPVGLICSFFLSPKIVSFYWFHGLVVWGWGYRIDSVLNFSQSADSFLILLIIISTLIVVLVA